MKLPGRQMMMMKVEKVNITMLAFIFVRLARLTGKIRQRFGLADASKEAVSELEFQISVESVVDKKNSIFCVVCEQKSIFRLKTL